MVNMERLRWLPRSMPADRVVVNTANASLVLYRDNRPIFTTRVVVGETDKQTPELQTTIDGVLFNPPWNVPPSIARSEILPKLAMDPGYLARHHMVYRRNGAIQQLPGPHAALGQIKFQMPNRFEPAKGPVALHGAVIRIDPETGRGLSIERVRVPLPA